VNLAAGGQVRLTVPEEPLRVPDRPLDARLCGLPGQSSSNTGWGWGEKWKEVHSSVVSPPKKASLSPSRRWALSDARPWFAFGMHLFLCRTKSLVSDNRATRQPL
jgi:hypothetical protein